MCSIGATCLSVCHAIRARCSQSSSNKLRQETPWRGWLYIFIKERKQ